MADHPAFDTLSRAIKALNHGRCREALALAEAAWNMVESIPGAPPQAALVGSWYGFLQAKIAGQLGEGIKRVREAAQTAFWEPKVFEHLALLELDAGSRRRALEALRRGLALAPESVELGRLRRRLGVRRRPALSFLDRGHPINRLLGQMRHRET